MSLSIWRATRDQSDVLTSIALTAKRHWNYPEHWIESWLPLLTISPEYIIEFEVWCGYAEDQIAGFYALSCPVPRAALEHLWVLPGFMGRGVGRALFLHAADLARAKGCRVVEIESDPNAVGFYEKMGAVLAGQRIGTVEGEPRVLPLLERNL